MHTATITLHKPLKQHPNYLIDAVGGGYDYHVSTTDEVDKMLLDGAVVAVGISGGKDGAAAAFRLSKYLDEVGHTGPRVLIHSDLGRVEWQNSIAQCQDMAKRIGWELIVVQRKAGDMMDRWETRWKNNVERYINLECVKLILPWSTPSLRFCTSEMKVTLISAELTKRYPKQQILSVTGVRHAESAARAKMGITSPQVKLSARGCYGVNWNPIITWPTEAVYAYHYENNIPLHEAYTDYGSSRVSCAFCIMGSLQDLTVSATCESNQDIYRTMVDLEVRSSFSFQDHQWLGDIAPHLLTEETRHRLELAKQVAEIRMAEEEKIPPHLLYQKGWPVAVPTYEDAQLLAEIRCNVGELLGFNMQYTTASSIIERYEQLISSKKTS